MLTRRAFLAMLASVPFLSRWNSIGTEEDSTLGDFDEAGAPSFERAYFSFDLYRGD
jgi:hypothetical protein